MSFFPPPSASSFPPTSPPRPTQLSDSISRTGSALLRHSFCFQMAHRNSDSEKRNSLFSLKKKISFFSEWLLGVFLSLVESVILCSPGGFPSDVLGLNGYHASQSQPMSHCCLTHQAVGEAL